MSCIKPCLFTSLYIDWTAVCGHTQCQVYIPGAGNTYRCRACTVSPSNHHKAVVRRYPCGGCSEKLRCGCLENVSVGVARVDSVVVARRSGIKLFSFTNTVETIVLHHTLPQSKRKVYGTRYSQAVTHPSTNRARRCLTSVIGREPVLST